MARTRKAGANEAVAYHGPGGRECAAAIGSGHAELKRLSKVSGVNAAGAGEIRNRSCNFAHPVVTSRAQPKPRGGRIQQTRSRGVERAVPGHQRWRQFRVRSDPVARVSLALAVTGIDDARADGGRWLAVGGHPKRVNWKRADFHCQIEPIPKRPRQTCAIPVDLLRSATALPLA